MKEQCSEKRIFSNWRSQLDNRLMIAVFACIGLYKAAKPAFNGRQAENGKAGAL